MQSPPTHHGGASPSSSSYSRPDYPRTSSSSNSGLQPHRRGLHEGVPIDVEGSDDEFGGDDYARSLRSSKLASLSETTRSSYDGLSYLNSEAFLIPPVPTDVPTTARSNFSDERFSLSQRSSTSAANSNVEDASSRRSSQQADDEEQYSSRSRLDQPASMLQPVPDSARADRRAKSPAASSISSSDSEGSHMDAVIVNLQEIPSPNAGQRAQVVPKRDMSRPSTATSSQTALGRFREHSGSTGPASPVTSTHRGGSIGAPSSPRVDTSSHTARRAGSFNASTEQSRRPQQQASENLSSSYASLSVKATPPTRTSPRMPAATLARPSSSSTTSSQTAAASSASFSTPLLAVLTTPLNPAYNRATASPRSASVSTSSPGLTAPPPAAVSSVRRYDEYSTRSASVSSSAGSTKGAGSGTRYNSSGAGHSSNGGVMRSASADDHGSPSAPRPSFASSSAQHSSNSHSYNTTSGSSNTGSYRATTSAAAAAAGAASAKSQSVENLHSQSSSSMTAPSFSRRQSGTNSIGRSAPPNPLNLQSSSRSFSGRGFGQSESVENLQDGAWSGRGGRVQSLGNGEPSPNGTLGGGSGGAGPGEIVPPSPGASSVRSSGSRFLSVGRKWQGYMHGNSSTESAGSSALQQGRPSTINSTNTFGPGGAATITGANGSGAGGTATSSSSSHPRTRSISNRSDGFHGDAPSSSLATTPSNGGHHPYSAQSRPSTAGSGPVDASTFPRPNALNGATWAQASAAAAAAGSGQRSPERASFTTGWEKMSQKPSTTAPESAQRVLTEDDVEYEEATHWGEPSSLFGIRRRLVASVPDLGAKSSTFGTGKSKSRTMMELPAMPQTALLGEKDYRKMEERLEQREKDLSVEVLAEQELATVSLVVFTEQREAKWITKGPASPHALPMDHLPSMNDPWGVRIDAKGIVARKKLKSNIELVSTRTTLRCPECTVVRQTRMNVQCHLCRGVEAVEMVYVVLVTIRMANFTPMQLPSALISGVKQPHFHYYEGDPTMRGAALQERAVDSALTAAKRVGQQHYAVHGSKLLMVKARVDRRRITSVAVLSTKTGKRRMFDLSDGHDGKVLETTPGRRATNGGGAGIGPGGLAEDAASMYSGPPRTPSTDKPGSPRANGGEYEHGGQGANGAAYQHAGGGGGGSSSFGKGLGRKGSMPSVIKQGSSRFGRRGSTDDSATIGSGEKGGAHGGGSGAKLRKKLFG
ncbi:hypothetical protein OC861_004876 [Tilletia horrida]|nr:hypothetical protein OC861_004876 [Tilletia horrida]